MSFSEGVGPLEIELFAFWAGLTPEMGGLGKINHFRNVVRMLWPKYIWHDWTDRQIGSLCDHKYVGWAGCAASGKTYGASLYAMIWWAVHPYDSAVVLTSTTGKMIRKRQWAALQELYHSCIGVFPGNMVDSKTTLQARAGDDKHGIFALPVLEGSTSKAAANIQGIHAKRILVIIDEATDTPEAIFEAVSNLEKGCSEFQLLCIGNPNSYFDQHGRFCEPAKGWKSVGVNTDEWLTKRGICVRFDGIQSPNIRSGKTIYPFLITESQVRAAKEHEGINSPRFWKYTRGFWAPEGVVNTILSEALCEKFSVRLDEVIASSFTVIAGLDPAFGGDRCILKFAKLGDRRGGDRFVQFYKTVQIQLDASSKDPIAFQIAYQVRAACEAEGCLPKHLAVDETGNGAGVCDVIAQTWSAEIRRVSFGSSPSDLPCSRQDPRPANDVYLNKVTELWYSFREWTKADQIRGMDMATIREFCARQYDDSKKKLVVEPKKDMKVRTGFSPDLADAAVLVIEVARQLGAEAPVVSASGNHWNKVIESTESVLNMTNDSYGFQEDYASVQ